MVAIFALTMVGSALAYNVGDYAYNSTQRFMVTGENLVANGDFANARDGWYGATKNDSPNPEVWDFAEGEGPNGENALKSLGATADMPLCNSWKLEETGTYIVSFAIKAPTAGITSVLTAGSSTVGSNVIDFFLNSNGSFTKEASTDDAPVVNVASSVNFSQEKWDTIVFYFTADQGQYLVMHAEKLATDIQITNIEVHAATEVYDVRIAQNKIAFAKELMENPAFNTEEAQDAKATLQGIIEAIEGMIASGGFDDASQAENMMISFNDEGLEPFLAVTSVDMKSLIPGLDIASLANWGRAGKYSDDYKLDLSGNWGHLNTEQDVLRSAIQTGYAHQATYAAFHEDFPAGKYFFSCEIRNANTGKTSWPTEPVFNLETTCKMFIGSDSIEVGPISGEAFQRFSMVAEVTEDGKFRAGVEWPGVSSGGGGAFFIRNTVVRAFNKDIENNVEHIQAFKTYMAQWDAATNGRTTVHNLIDNANYPWGQNELKAEADRLDPIYAEQANKNWNTSDGADAGIASTDELKDWALYQGIEAYSEPTEEGAEPKRLEYQLVRGYQGAANAIQTTNKIITDLGEAIDAAKKTRNTGAYLTGDRETYKTAILTALYTLKDIRSKTTDATREADSTTLDNALAELNAATEAFLASVTNAPFIDIDFSNKFTEDTAEEAPASYYIEGTAGRMYFNAREEDNNTGTGFALGVGEEYMDVLRVGNGTAFVLLPEENQPGESDAVRVSFDFYHGNLSGRNAGIELQNAAGQRVAGFSLNRYNGTLAYNDFNDVLTNGGEGMNILKYASGVGSSSASNAAIAAASNKTTYTLVVDYKNKTLQGTIINAKNGTCEGKAMSFRADLEDQKVVKFALISNYNNKDRRCWFDNLKITKYALSDVEEDITEETWAPVGIKGDVNSDGEVNVADLIAVSNHMAGDEAVAKEKADVNGDGEVNVADLIAISNIMAGTAE
jgi:hypothetical protein